MARRCSTSWRRIRRQRITSPSSSRSAWSRRPPPAPRRSRGRPLPRHQRRPARGGEDHRHVA
jgi:hypothetical protein